MLAMAQILSNNTVFVQKSILRLIPAGAEKTFWKSFSRKSPLGVKYREILSNYSQ